VIASMSAVRGMRGNATVYAASKAGVAALAEGIRADRLRGVTVSTIYPGYIRSEMNERVRKAPFIVDTVTGVTAMVVAIDREPATAYVPALPWRLIGIALKRLPLSVVRRFG
jgi:NAD(P)-dependent dehydrogenase (short-subunit alcohol dehydrogenase family)